MKFFLLNVFLVAVTVLESSLFPYLDIFGVAPHITLILLIGVLAKCLSHSAYHPRLLWSALIAGLFADLQSVRWFGFYSVFFLTVAISYYLVGRRFLSRSWMFTLWGIGPLLIINLIDYRFGSWGKVGSALLVDIGILLITYPLAQVLGRKVSGKTALQLSFEDTF